MNYTVPKINEINNAVGVGSINYAAMKSRSDLYVIIWLVVNIIVN